MQMRGETSLLAAGKVLWVLPVSAFIPRYLVDMSKLFSFGRGTENSQTCPEMFGNPGGESLS